MPGEGVEVKVRGVRQLSAGTRQLFANIDRATVNDAVRVSAEQTAATIRSRVPVSTGALRASVRDEMHGKTGVGRRWAPACRYAALDRVRRRGAAARDPAGPLRVPDGQADRAGVRQALRRPRPRDRSGA